MQVKKMTEYLVLENELAQRLSNQSALSKAWYWQMGEGDTTTTLSYCTTMPIFKQWVWLRIGIERCVCAFPDLPQWRSYHRMLVAEDIVPSGLRLAILEMETASFLTILRDLFSAEVALEGVALPSDVDEASFWPMQWMDASGVELCRCALALSPALRQHLMMIGRYNLLHTALVSRTFHAQVVLDVFTLQEFERKHLVPGDALVLSEMDDRDTQTRQVKVVIEENFACDAQLSASGELTILSRVIPYNHPVLPYVWVSIGTSLRLPVGWVAQWCRGVFSNDKLKLAHGSCLTLWAEAHPCAWGHLTKLGAAAAFEIETIAEERV